MTAFGDLSSSLDLESRFRARIASVMGLPLLHHKACSRSDKAHALRVELAIRMTNRLRRRDEVETRGRRGSSVRS